MERRGIETVGRSVRDIFRRLRLKRANSVRSVPSVTGRRFPLQARRSQRIFKLGAAGTLVVGMASTLAVVAPTGLGLTLSAGATSPSCLHLHRFDAELIPCHLV